MKRLLVGSFSTLVLGTAASPACAGSAVAGIPITATISEVCNVEGTALELDERSGRIVGSVFEMCNSMRGFQVLASYRPLEQGEQVRVSYNGQSSDLGASGMSPIAYRSGATFGSVPIVIESSGLKQGIAISIGMMAV